MTVLKSVIASVPWNGPRSTGTSSILPKPPTSLGFSVPVSVGRTGAAPAVEQDRGQSSGLGAVERRHDSRDAGDGTVQRRATRGADLAFRRPPGRTRRSRSRWSRLRIDGVLDHTGQTGRVEHEVLREVHLRVGRVLVRRPRRRVRVASDDIHEQAVDRARLLLVLLAARNRVTTSAGPEGCRLGGARNGDREGHGCDRPRRDTCSFAYHSFVSGHLQRPCHLRRRRPFLLCDQPNTASPM